MHAFMDHECSTSGFDWLLVPFAAVKSESQYKTLASSHRVGSCGSRSTVTYYDDILANAIHPFRASSTSPACDRIHSKQYSANCCSLQHIAAIQHFLPNQLYLNAHTMLPSSRMASRHQKTQPFLLQPNLILASTAMAEFMGTMLLQLLAGSTNNPARAAAAYAGLSKHQLLGLLPLLD